MPDLAGNVVSLQLSSTVGSILSLITVGILSTICLIEFRRVLRAMVATALINIVTIGNVGSEGCGGAVGGLVKSVMRQHSVGSRWAE
jgi:hypothetical protein